MIERFIRFVIEDPYPIGFLSGIIIARSFWFPWWGYGPAVYLLALLMLAPLAAPRITARMAIEIPRSRSASHPSARRHSGRSVANRQLSGGSFPAVATHGQEMPVTAASTTQGHLDNPRLVRGSGHLGAVPVLRRYRGDKESEGLL